MRLRYQSTGRRVATCAIVVASVAAGAATPAQAAPIPAAAGSQEPREAARGVVQASGKAAVGSRLVARWGGGRATARWQTRDGPRWRSFGPSRRGRQLVLRPRASLAGRFIRAQARLNGRWIASRPRLVGPRVRLTGRNRAGSSLRLVSPSRGEVRWQARTPGGRWSTIRRESALGDTAPRTLSLPERLAGQQVRAVVRLFGRWWPSPPRRVLSAPVLPLAQTSPAAAAPPPPPPPPPPAPIPAPAPSPAPEPVGPAVGVQDDHLPVDPLLEIPGRMDDLADTGIRFTRVDVFWSDIAPARPSNPRDHQNPAYDWTRLDAVATGLAERDIQPVFSFYSTPEWVTGAGPPAGTPVNPAIPDASAVGDFVTALVTRYSGTFIAPGDTDPLPALEYLEVWNEPNKQAFLSPQEDALDAYVAIAREGHDAAKAVDPDLTVLVGALGSGGDARDFLDRIIAEDLDLDALSHHFYPAAAPLTPTIAYPSWSSLPEIVGKLDAWRPGTPIVVTEAGYTTQETPFRPPGTAVTEEEQAQRLTDIFDVPLVTSSRVSGVVWFNFQDNSGWPAGLLREDGTAKPSYGAFVTEVEEHATAPLP